MQRARVYFWKWVCNMATRMQARLQHLLQGPQLRPLQVTWECVLAQVQAPNSVLVPARVFFLGGEATSKASGGWRRVLGALPAGQEEKVWVLQKTAENIRRTPCLSQPLMLIGKRRPRGRAVLGQALQ